MCKYVAYFRVSTQSQGVSGLGIDSQKASVAAFAKNDEIVAEFEEHESGKKHTNRPQLAAALAECKKHKATLIIAKLDRLARNVAFISSLMESNIEFIACDMPQANRLTIHILAAVAEHEREMISQRTKAALAEARKRGVALGNPRMAEMQEKARQSHHAGRPADDVVKLMQDWKAQGKTLRAIAEGLNRLNLKTARGKDWYAATVRAVLNYSTGETAQTQESPV